MTTEGELLSIFFHEGGVFCFTRLRKTGRSAAPKRGAAPWERREGSRVLRPVLPGAWEVGVKEDSCVADARRAWRRLEGGGWEGMERSN